LLGYLIIVFTYHKNNTFIGLKAVTSNFVLRWLLVIEEYRVKFEYLPGNRKKNKEVDAGALSCLEIDNLKI
jgi:hypothetical protein